MTLPWFFSPSWTMLGGSVVAVAAVAFPFGAYVGAGHEKDKATAALLKATEKARQTEQNLHDDYGVLNDLKDEELRGVNAKLAAATARLRDRPERLPGPAQAACAGSSGAVLSRPDAQFLNREAARADGLRTELWACQAREWEAYDALKRAP